MSRCLGAKGRRAVGKRFLPPGLGSRSNARGGVPRTKPQGFMRTKRAVAVDPDKATTPTAVRRLLSEISTEDLEPLVVEVIREHRRRLQRAQALFETLERKDENPSVFAELRQLRQDYYMAMLNLHAQHQLVSLVVAALGYVPDVDGPPSATDAPTR